MMPMHGDGPRTSSETSLDLRAGAEVIVVVRILSIIFLAAFIQFLDDLPHRPVLVAVLGAVLVSHVLWWYQYVHGTRPMTKAVAIGSLLGDVIGTGIGVLLTGGPSSPVVLIFGSTCAATAIWVGLRDGIPVIATIVGFMVTSAYLHTGQPVQLTPLQMAIFASFWFILIAVHGDVVAAYKRAFQTEIHHAEEQATIDALTQLANRQGFETYIAEVLAEAATTGQIIAVAILDVDNFKSVNDTHGHSVGDDVLRVVADHMRLSVRDGDMAARLGGEEFALVLPGAPAEEASAIIDRIRCRVRTAGPIEGVTFSAGVAHYPTSGTTRDQIFQAADRAMYVAKGAGKDRTSIATAPAIDRRAPHVTDARH
jgi:diguanylate cyclase (GGDEF)-like protein